MAEAGDTGREGGGRNSAVGRGVGTPWCIGGGGGWGVDRMGAVYGCTFVSSEGVGWWVGG